MRIGSFSSVEIGGVCSAGARVVLIASRVMEIQRLVLLIPTLVITIDRLILITIHCVMLNMTAHSPIVSASGSIES